MGLTDSRETAKNLVDSRKSFLKLLRLSKNLKNFNR